MTDHPLIEPLTKRIEDLEAEVAELILKVEHANKRIDHIEKALVLLFAGNWTPYKEGIA
jgi:chaperonin cofactor prefoldin